MTGKVVSKSPLLKPYVNAKKASANNQEIIDLISSDSCDDFEEDSPEEDQDNEHKHIDKKRKVEEKKVARPSMIKRGGGGGASMAEKGLSDSDSDLFSSKKPKKKP